MPIEGEGWASDRAKPWIPNQITLVSCGHDVFVKDQLPCCTCFLVFTWPDTNALQWQTAPAPCFLWGESRAFVRWFGLIRYMLISEKVGEGQAASFLTVVVSISPYRTVPEWSSTQQSALPRWLWMGFSASVRCSCWQGLWLWVCSHLSHPHPLKRERSDSWHLFARRWEWLHQRLPDGALPAWRQALRDRGRHQWSAQTYHRQGLQRSFQVKSAREKGSTLITVRPLTVDTATHNSFLPVILGSSLVNSFPPALWTDAAGLGLGGMNQSVAGKEKNIFFFSWSAWFSVLQSWGSSRRCAAIKAGCWAVHLEQEVATAEHKLNPKKGQGNNLVLFLKSSAIK